MIRLPKLTADNFLELARLVHGDKYDYSLVKYKTATYDKIKIKCPKHGIFEKIPSQHIKQKSGCPECSREQFLDQKYDSRQTKEQFVKKARKLYGYQYDYSESDYRGSEEDITIRCKEHGYFTVKAKNHVSYRYLSGCPDCPSSVKPEIKELRRNRSTHHFIVKAKLAHGDKFDYSKTVYRQNMYILIVICPVHGEIRLYPQSHIEYGCLLCHKESFKQQKS